MTERDDATALVRRLASVTDEQVSRAAGAEAREGLLEGIAAMPAPTTTPGRRRSRPALVAGVTAATLGATAAIGWAIVASNARDTTGLQCEIPGSSSIIPAASGDPVADCAAEWQRQTGRAAPPLVAYDNGHGGIVVADAAQPPPEGATPLAPGATQNTALVELEQSLDDHVAGLRSRCFDEAGATRFATAQLERLGLTGWSVRVGPERGRCFDAAVNDPAARTVTLRSLGDVPDPALPFMRLAVKLRDVADECLPLEAMAARVEAAAKQVGMSAGRNEYQLTKVETEGRCTTVHQTVGGTVFLTLRGPR